MLFQIRHVTHYRYSRPVALGAHWIRMRPFSNGIQQLVKFEQVITPRPVGTSECTDLYGNAATRVWFVGPAQCLSVAVSVTVKTERENPFDFLLPSANQLRLPLTYEGSEAAVAAPYLVRRNPHPTIASFAYGLMNEAGHDAARFLPLLNESIHRRCRHYFREHGEPFPPERTLAECGGSCRDLAVLFIDACRAVGVAARFASGYLHSDPAPDRRFLHAWAEAYLSGAGWRGYDPTHCLAVADRHVLVAVGATPPEAAPISGGYWGTNARAEMQTKIDITTHATISSYANEL